MKLYKLSSCLLLLVLSFMFVNFALAADTVLEAQNVTEISNERASTGTAANHSAYAGNVTELTVFGYSITRSWQGYYGNVTGSLILSDASRNIMYNWTLASPRGQIYSSVNGSGIQWNYLQCFNYTANGSLADDTANAGSTSVAGLNLTQLQSRYNINSSGFDGSIRSSADPDAVDHTFTYWGDGTGVDGAGHRQFYANSLDFSQGECWTTRVYGQGGSQNANEFEEVLLYEPQSTGVIFTALLNDDLTGFDSNTHDFEMLVLEDGHGTDTATTTYYFYTELY